jgi:hypothetical protein
MVQYTECWLRPRAATPVTLQTGTHTHACTHVLLERQVGQTLRRHQIEWSSAGLGLFRRRYLQGEAESIEAGYGCRTRENEIKKESAAFT